MQTWVISSFFYLNTPLLGPPMIG